MSVSERADIQKYCEGSIPPLGFLSGKLSMSESRLFVGNLSYQTMENDLQDYFAQAGVVSSVNLMLDKFTGKSRGFAFIEYADPADASKAVDMFHGKEFQGRALTVNIARPREDRPPREGGGGYRDRGDRGDRGERRERRY
jgi:RNA recognition motif-containing protein